MLSKIRKIFSNSDFWLIIFLGAVLAVGASIAWPMLGLGWDLVDDGISLAGAHLIKNAINLGSFEIAKPLFLEDVFVRFRPVFWIWFWAIYSFFGTNIFIFHLIRLLMFVISGLLFFGIIYLLTKSKIASLIGSLIYLIQPFDITNWYFLGHHEALQNFFVLLSFFLLILSFKTKRRLLYVLSLLTVPLIFWSKETAIAILGPLGLMVIYQCLIKSKNTKKWLIYFLVSLVACLIMIATLKYLSMTGEAGYFGKYDADLTVKFINTFKNYWRHLLGNFSNLYFLPLIAFLIGLIKNRKITDLVSWQLFFLIGHVGLFLIIVPFTLRTESYYLATSFLFYLLFANIELAKLISFNKKLLWLIVPLSLFLLVRNYIYVDSYVKEFVLIQASNSQMMERVVELTPQYSQVLFNFAAEDRGYMNGIKIQRSSIFPCDDLLIIDAEIIYGQENHCPLQTLIHVPTAETEIEVNDFELLVVGDLAHQNLVIPLEEIKTPLTKISEIKQNVAIFNRSTMLEKYLKNEFEFLIAQLKNSLKTRKVSISFHPFPQKEIVSEWNLYKIN